jgi:hypothetical protein
LAIASFAASTAGLKQFLTKSAQLGGPPWEREHERVPVLRPASQRPGDLLGNRARHPHDARLMRLHRTPLQTTDLNRRLDHPSGAAKQIQAADPERDQLARTQSRVGSKQEERPESGLRD